MPNLPVTKEKKREELAKKGLGKSRKQETRHKRNPDQGGLISESKERKKKTAGIGYFWGQYREKQQRKGKGVKNIWMDQKNGGRSIS